MILGKKRKILKLLVCFAFLWLCGSLYTYTSLDSALQDVFGRLKGSRLDDIRLKELMCPTDNPLVLPEPLSQLVLPENLLSFYHLPLRKADRLYTEVTSANRDTSYPLAPDFSFHIHYKDREVTLYEDYGPGCIYRIYLFPALPRTAEVLHKMTAKDLDGLHIKFEIDSAEFKYNLQQFAEGSEWPFMYPLSTRHPTVSSGMGSYTPICYQESMKVSYIHKEILPENLFELTINCSKNDLLCPTHIYSGISRHKFPKEMKVPTFAPFAQHWEAEHHHRLLRQAVHLLENPELNGPMKGQRCLLDCVEMCSNCNKKIFSHNGPGVISNILLRVFETATGIMESNWTNILFTAHFDSSIKPQVYKVPLGDLFGVTASLNDFRGAAAGHRRRHCAYKDPLLSLPQTAMIGYLYYPMPFWRNARITLEGTEFIHSPLLACFQISMVPNYYKERDTGYFYAQKSYYTSDVSGYREMLSLNNTWGHVVGVNVDIDNLKAQRGVPVNERWAALQADAVLFLDGQKSASMLGTGLEDYFSYSHGFFLAENTTYSFVGNYHAGPHQSEPLTWHAYRQHVVDPIVFHTSIQFIMEGTVGAFHQPAHRLTFQEHVLRKTDGQGALSHLLFYYARAHSGVTLTDELRFGNTVSESEHMFKFIPFRDLNSVPETFQLSKKRYLGASNSNQTFSKTGREFQSGDKISFRMRLFTPNKGMILRREFHSLPGTWNEQATVWVDDMYLGTWFIPMGALSSEYSLRQEDFIIGDSVCGGKQTVEIAVYPQTKWRDISYQVLTIHLSG